ncbi:MAG: hypothetical protein R2788_11565 [Saprospiraceae bacterium]
MPGVAQNYQPDTSQNEEEESIKEELMVEEKIAEESLETFVPFADLPILEEEEEVIDGQETTSQSNAIFFEIPKEESETIGDASTASPTPAITSAFQEFMNRAVNFDLQPGQIYRLDGATFGPNIWQLTPKLPGH